MSWKAQQALKSLSKSIELHTPQIEATLKKAGVNPDPALVYSAAKYFEALNRLATK